MSDTNDPREDLQAAQQWAEEEAPSLAQVCYATYAQALALPWTHAYADLPPHLRLAWEAVAAALEAHWQQALHACKEGGPDA